MSVSTLAGRGREDNMNDELERAFVDLVIESWRFSKAFKDVLTRLNEEEYMRYNGRYKWFRKKLDEIAASDGIRIEEIDSGTEYDTGMSVNPINIEDFNADESLQVEQMLDPVIMKNDSLLKTGTVILRKADKS